MRIDNVLRALVAVLHLAVLLISLACILSHSVSAASQHRHHRNLPQNFDNNSDNISETNENKIVWSQRLPYSEKQLYIMQERKNATNLKSGGAECCPSKLEMTEPMGGVNMDGRYVKLYRGENNKRQRFHEFSCLPHVENKPCQFVDRKLNRQSRCVQQYTYSYALIEEDPSKQGLNTGQEDHSVLNNLGNLTLDYIRVRSGCTCVLFPQDDVILKSKNKKTSKRPHHENGPT